MEINEIAGNVNNLQTDIARLQENLNEKKKLLNSLDKDIAKLEKYIADKRLCLKNCSDNLLEIIGESSINLGSIGNSFLLKIKHEYYIVYLGQNSEITKIELLHCLEISAGANPNDSSLPS